MLDSAIEPSYNLSKNLVLLPWILKLIVDMANDTTPLLHRCLLCTDRDYILTDIQLIFLEHRTEPIISLMFVRTQ